MFERFERVVRNVVPIVFSRENALRISGGMLLTGTNIGFNFLPPIILSQTVSSLSTNENTHVLGLDISPLAMSGLYGASWLANQLILNTRNLVFTPIGPYATKKIVLRYVDHLMNQSLNHHQSTPLGDHISRLSKCYMSMPSVSTQLLTQIIPTTAELVVASSLLSHWYGAKIGLSLAGIVSIYAGYNLATKQLITKLRENAIKNGFQTYEKTMQILTNYETIHSFNNLPHEIQQLSQALKNYAQSEANANTIFSKIGFGQSFISGIGFTLLALMVAQGVITGEYSLQDFILIITYLAAFFIPLNLFGSALSQLISSLRDLDTLFRELSMQPQVVDLYPNKELVVTSQTADIEFKNVSFTYENGTQILNDVSFVAKAGQKTGIVGASGAGKSTIGNLIFRFFDPSSGEIYINEQNIKDVGLDSLRSHISIVPQTPVLFNDTLENNIAYAGMSRLLGVSREEVERAVQSAHLTEFVATLPNRLDTIVGERGAKVSGGQRQRLAIARALIKNPDVFIFDEATSALDATSEKIIQKNMDKNSKGKTSIVITHRLSNLVNADKIIVLHEGKIAEQGTHQELINIPHGIYAKSWKKQNPAEKSAILPNYSQGSSRLYVSTTPGISGSAPSQSVKRRPKN